MKEEKNYHADENYRHDSSLQLVREVTFSRFYSTLTKLEDFGGKFDLQTDQLVGLSAFFTNCQKQRTVSAAKPLSGNVPGEEDSPGLHSIFGHLVLFESFAMEEVGCSMSDWSKRVTKHSGKVNSSSTGNKRPRQEFERDCAADELLRFGLPECVDFVLRKKCGAENDLKFNAERVCEVLVSSMSAREATTEGVSGKEAQVPTEDLGRPSGSLAAGLEPLPVWRAMPWQVVSFVSVVTQKDGLKKTVNTENLCRASRQNCEHLLRVSPCRRVAFCAVTDLSSLVFVAVIARTTDSRDVPASYEHFIGGLISGNQNVARELAVFFATTAEALGGAQYSFPCDLLSISRAEGRGSTGCVMSGSADALAEPVVVKVARNSAALWVENKILTFLHITSSASLKHCIPVVQRATQKQLHDRKDGHTLVLSGRFYHHHNQLTVEHLLDAWALLALLHEVNVVHGDVRLSNFMLQKDPSETR